MLATINTNTIIRFAPTGTLNPTTDVVYNGGPESALTPVCGRFTSTGAFYVTNQSSASSTTATVYEFANVANVKLGQLPASTPYRGCTPDCRQTVQRMLGLRKRTSVTCCSLITPITRCCGRRTELRSHCLHLHHTNLSSPEGIARISTGDVFVANGGSSNVAHFNSSGSSAANCPTLSFPDGAGNTSLFFLASSETDVIYAAASTSSADYAEDLDFQAEGDNPGEVWSWNPGQATCTLVSVATSQTVLSGVAVAPIPTAPIQQTLTATAASPTPATFSFNSNEFQLIATGCTATVSANPLSLANINSMINLAKTNAAGGLPNGGTPIVNLGEGGYEIAYVANWSGCTGVLSGGLFGDFIFGLFDPNLSGNTQIIQCDSNPPDTSEPLLNGTNTCEALPLIGSYPLGGPIPLDNGVGGGGRANSVFFLANANPTTVVTEQGQFCGFLPPNGTTFDTDDFVLVAFQLAQKNGNCKTGPFIGDAQVLLSVAEISPTFAPILQLHTLLNLGSTFPRPGLCKFFPHSILACTYALVVDVHKSGLTPGTYSLSAQPETGNAGTEAVTFNVVPESK